MKNALIGLTVVFLTGCFEDNFERTDLNDAKFTAGQNVKTTVTFYKNCKGVVEDILTYRRKQELIGYQVCFYCPNIGWLEDMIKIEENELIPVLDE